MSATSSTQRVPLNIAVLTVSDTRDLSTDTSGQFFVDACKEQKHHLADRAIVKDDVYQMRAQVSKWIASPEVQAILVTGGTGFTSRDSTPEALGVLFDKEILGFGEVFRAESFKEIGTSTIQSRALAGMANKTVIFCCPGSTGACKTAWKIIEPQLDSTHRPCNFVEQLKRPA